MSTDKLNVNLTFNPVAMAAALERFGQREPKATATPAFDDLVSDIAGALTTQPAPVDERAAFEATDFQLELLFDAAHHCGDYGREFRERARVILAARREP